MLASYEAHVLSMLSSHTFWQPSNIFTFRLQGFLLDFNASLAGLKKLTTQLILNKVVNKQS